MKVVLLKAIKGIGQPGELVNVGDAYARNFLLPNKVAIMATPDQIAKVQLQLLKKTEQRADRAAHEQRAQSILAGVTINFIRPGVPGKHLYVGLKTIDVAREIEHQYHIPIERAEMSPAVIKSTGPTTVTLTWPDRKTTTFTVVVDAEAEPTRR